MGMLLTSCLFPCRSCFRGGRGERCHDRRPIQGYVLSSHNLGSQSPHCQPSSLLTPSSLKQGESTSRSEDMQTFVVEHRTRGSTIAPLWCEKTNTTDDKCRADFGLSSRFSDPVLQRVGVQRWRLCQHLSELHLPPAGEHGTRGGSELIPLSYFFKCLFSVILILHVASKTAPRIVSKSTTCISPIP